MVSALLTYYDGPKAAWLLSQAKERLQPDDQQLLDALWQTNAA